MKPSAASPNANAIGMPDSTIAPTPTTKKTTRFQRPSAANTAGTTPASTTSATTPASTPQMTATCARHASRVVRIRSCSVANTIIRPRPIGSAAARQAFAMPSAGVVMSASPRA